MTQAPAEAPDDVPEVGAWADAEVVEVERVGEGDTRFVRLRLAVAGHPEGLRHLPGQHCVLRLRAADGYTAQRSYSIASDPADPLVELMVEALPDGEVSGHLHDVVEPGDLLELRGPVGRWFTWGGRTSRGPAVCVVGGSGVVPAVAMLRHAARLGVAERLQVVAVAQTLARLPYAAELRAAGAFVALTRENLEVDGVDRVAAPPYPDEVVALLDRLEQRAGPVERAFVCGSPGFATYATRLLGESGVRGSLVRVEQFGDTS